MRVTAFSVPPLRNNAYLVVDEGSLEAAVIDPAQGAQKILATLKLAGATVRFILNTHGHADHTADDAALKEATGAKVGIHEVDANRLEKNARDARPYLEAPTPPVKPDLLLKEGSEIRLGETVLVVLHTPGHTEGSAAFHAASEGILFSGDTVLAGTSGRTDIQGGSPAKMAASLRRLYREISPETRVCPGHGPETTMRAESWIADLTYPLLR
ncbi:MAG TPA: MBL fold metallo-hydrolase [Thermoplasmata archaeon]|nr:MBL fold metallo-hydrolase [Thermoplasmata archaeon]